MRQLTHTRKPLGFQSVLVVTRSLAAQLIAIGGHYNTNHNMKKYFVSIKSGLQ